jgi:hypothetical protein
MLKAEAHHSALAQVAAHHPLAQPLLKWLVDQAPRAREIRPAALDELIEDHSLGPAPAKRMEDVDRRF